MTSTLLSILITALNLTAPEAQDPDLDAPSAVIAGIEWRGSHLGADPARGRIELAFSADIHGVRVETGVECLDAELLDCEVVWESVAWGPRNVWGNP